jgi:hypothetical protein
LVKNAYAIGKFKFQNVEFDFSNYNRASVDTLLDQINWIEKFTSKSIVS